MDRFIQSYLIQPVAVLLLRLLYIAQRQTFDLGLPAWLRKQFKVGALMRQVRWKIVRRVLSVELLLTQDMRQRESERHEKRWAKSLSRKK